MAGHSKWAKIKRGKASEDAKRGAAFTKLANAIALAARAGADPDMNPTLAMAVQKAKAANMPNANIERSIKRGSGELGGAAIEETVYEAYGPGGIAVIIEGATDNKKRTVADVRTAITKNGGSMAESGAVLFQFERKGVIQVKKTGNDDDDQLTAIDAGAEDVFDEDEVWAVHTDPKELHAVRQKLEAANLRIESADLAYTPKQTIEINQEKVEKVMKFMNALDDLDDVTNVYSNFDIKD